MISLILFLICFFILYTVALVSNINNKEDDDILGVSIIQWEAIIIMLLPSLLVLFK